MKLFKSFDEIIQEEIRIEDILVNYNKYHAHTHKKRDYEKLHEHVHLVMEYATKLVKAHGLDAIVDSMINELLKINSKIRKIEIVGNFVKRLFVNALIYHDYGKVNENFQIEKMQDKLFFKPNESNKIGSQHSILSAYIFLNIHLKEVIENSSLSSFEKSFLAVSTFLFASPIVKHHASFFQYQVEFEEIKIKSLEQYLKLFKTTLTSSIKKSLEHSDKIIEKITKNYSSDGQNYFSFFALLKLNFSLLTASDYYATNDFMGDMPLNDFGLIDKKLKEELFDNFINNPKASYNGELMERIDHYNLSLIHISEPTRPY